MTDPSARSCAAAVHHAVSRVGGAFMVDPCVAATSDRLGLTFFEYYVVGRAGVLGRVPASAVGAELTLLAPDAVVAAWDRVVSVADPTAVAQSYAGNCADWGRRRLAAAPPDLLLRVAASAARLVAALPVDDLPLVAGWRALPLPSDLAARVAVLLQTLREFRGAVHARAVTAAGLSPVEAIVAGPDGPDRAVLLGWSGPFPSAEPFATRRARAEMLTDTGASVPFTALTGPERAQFRTDCAALLALVRSHAADPVEEAEPCTSR